jgi:hypothetical protein
LRIVRYFILFGLAAGLFGASPAHAQQSYASVWLTDLNYNTQYPCGNPTATNPTQQITTSFKQAAHYGGGTVDWTCYQTAFTLTADIFSPITADILIWGGEHAITVNANATIPANFEICFGPGGSIAAGGGFTLTNNSTPCLGGGGGGGTCPGSAVPTQILYDNGGNCAGIPTSGVDVPNTRVLWQYFESFGPPYTSMNAYFSSFEFQPHNFITNIETSTPSIYNLGIYEQDDGLTGFANGLTIQALETATEDSATALNAECVVVDGSFCQGATIYGTALSGTAAGAEGLFVGTAVSNQDNTGIEIGLGGGPGANRGMEIDSYTPDGFSYGLEIDAMTGGTTNYGVDVADVSDGSAGNYSIFTGAGLASFGDWTSFGTDTYANLLAQAALLPGEGFQKNCSDCDTPAYAGAPCSDTFDHGGAIAVYIDAGLYCYGKSASSSGAIVNVSTSVGTALIPANSCTDPPITLAMPGVVGGTGGSTFSFTAETDTNAVVGWGSTNGLQFIAWPSPDNVNFRVCNITGSDITPSDTVVFNISAK